MNDKELVEWFNAITNNQREMVKGRQQDTWVIFALLLLVILLLGVILWRVW